MGSVGVIISTLLMENFGWLIADPICSLFIATLILVSVVPLLRESAAILLLATPGHKQLYAALDKVSGGTKQTHMSVMCFISLILAAWSDSC